VIKGTPAMMDAALFRAEPMGLRERLLRLPLADRFSFDAEQNMLFINFEGLAVKSQADVDAIRDAALQLLQPLGHRVQAIVNYDNFHILPDLVAPYAAMVQQLVEQHYSAVSRYTASSFQRMKLGAALQQRGLAPHLFENADDARRDIESGP
jgi:propionate CoA-transferase